MTELARPDLHAAIEQRYPDNTTERITPELLRDGLHEIVDSVTVKASDGGAVPNVPLYKAGTDYAKDYTVRYPTGTGVEAFYYSLRAGKLPAPSGSSADVNWKVVAGPVSTTALSQQLTLLQAQGIEGSLVVEGRTYSIDCGPNAQGQAQVVTVRGVNKNLFDVEGTLEVAGHLTPIQAFDVVAGTWQLKSSGADLLPKDNIWSGFNTYEQTLTIKNPRGTQSTSIDWFPKGLTFYDTDSGDYATLEAADFSSINAPGGFNSYVALAKATQEIINMPGSRTRWVQGGLTNPTAATGPKGSIGRPYASLADAHNAAGENDTIIVLPGGNATDALGRRCYSGYTLITKNVTIHNMPGVIHSGSTDIGMFRGEKPYRVHWHGGILIGTINIIRQSTGPSYFLGQDISLEDIVYIQGFSLGTYGTHRDTVDLRRLVGRQQSGAAQAVLLTGRSDGPQVQDVILTGPDLESVNSPLLRWSGSDGAGVSKASQFILRNWVRFVRSDGGSYLVITPTTPDGVQRTEAEVITNEAVSGGGAGTVKTVNGAGPDASGNVVVAASSGTATPSGTVLVFTQDAEYAAIYSGTFTVDVTGAKVGAVVTAYLGPATTQPVLDPATFQLVNGYYASGLNLMYMFKVGNNGKIQYTISTLL
jgi:hypothetical protein